MQFKVVFVVLRQRVQRVDRRSVDRFCFVELSGQRVKRGQLHPAVGQLHLQADIIRRRLREFLKPRFRAAISGLGLFIVEQIEPHVAEPHERLARFGLQLGVLAFVLSEPLQVAGRQFEQPRSRPLHAGVVLQAIADSGQENVNCVPSIDKLFGRFTTGFVLSDPRLFFVLVRDRDQNEGDDECDRHGGDRASNRRAQRLVSLHPPPDHLDQPRCANRDLFSVQVQIEVHHKIVGRLNTVGDVPFGRPRNDRLDVAVERRIVRSQQRHILFENRPRELRFVFALAEEFFSCEQFPHRDAERADVSLRPQIL